MKATGVKTKMKKKEMVKIDFFAVKADWLKFTKIAEKELLSASALLRRVLHDFIAKQK